ncbi:response regulator [Pararhizobium sp.]|uniref:response regulator n=1 Tax=Pararhizobium sp. TaxID=1977563 RepID=UPI00271C41B2|nr:response regulator [Pararhizobium sp.]MDO9415559.1 hypothetical protein [Pararhizobium sp.]
MHRHIIGDEWADVALIVPDDAGAELTLKPRLLFLEGQPIVAMDLEQAMSEAGFDVNWFTTVKSGLYWLERHQPDIALLDIELSDGSCQAIAGNLVERGVPFIVHSGHPSAADFVHESFRAGLWVGKPIDYGDLLALLAELASGGQQGARSER